MIKLSRVMSLGCVVAGFLTGIAYQSIATPTSFTGYWVTGIADRTTNFGPFVVSKKIIFFLPKRAADTRPRKAVQIWYFGTETGGIEIRKEVSNEYPP